MALELVLSVCKTKPISALRAAFALALTHDVIRAKVSSGPPV
jgi:hypothetical protein